MNKRKNDDAECGDQEYSIFSTTLDVCNTSEEMEQINTDTMEQVANTTVTTAVMEALQESAASQTFAEFACQVPGCVQFFETVLDYDTHYNMKHRHTCATCKKSLLTAHFLDLHILETHDTLFELMAERRPMFSCYVDTCLEKFKNAKDRHDHGVTMHGYSKNFMYSQNPNKFHWQQSGTKKGNQKKQTSKQHKNFQKTVVSNCENNEMEVEDQNTAKVSDKQVKNAETKKEMNNAAPRLHISFGHRTNKVFSRKHTFGMKPDNKDKAAEANMNLDKLKEAIMETTPTTV